MNQSIPSIKNKPNFTPIKVSRVEEKDELGSTDKIRKYIYFNYDFIKLYSAQYKKRDKSKFSESKEFKDKVKMAPGFNCFVIRNLKQQIM